MSEETAQDLNIMQKDEEGWIKQSQDEFYELASVFSLVLSRRDLTDQERLGIIEDYKNEIESIVRQVEQKAIDSTSEHFMNQELPVILEKYTQWLYKYSYTDSDTWSEEPRAVDRFLEDYKEAKE